MLILICIGLGLAACSTATVDRSSDGSTVYIDELSDARKAELREQIVRQLGQDVAVFQLGIGDQINVFFDINPKPMQEPYLISVRDKLRVDFLNDVADSRVLTVRPDGQISLPRVGSVIAEGKTPDALAYEIERAYTALLDIEPHDIEPQITVNVVESHSPLDRLISMIGPSTTSQSLILTVLPDGTITPPLLPSIEARGRSLREVQQEIDSDYSALGLGVTVSLVPRFVRPGSTMIFGEVGKPGRIQLDRPHTVLMTVAQAGGVLPSGSMKAVRVVYVDSDGQPHIRVINLVGEIKDLKIEDDMIVPDNSVIYVPATVLTEAARIMDVVMGSLLRYNGFSMGAAYILNQVSTTAVVH
jgi:polysaccharide export outer membrane protein